MRVPQPRATLWIMGATVVAWGAAALSGQEALLLQAAGFIPARFSAALSPSVAALPAVLTPLSATLLHGGIVHLAFNMLMLGYCGRFVEYALGMRGLLLLYVIGAYAAALAQFGWSPHETVPMVGASGAISALIGAYALLFGQREAPALSGRRGTWIQILRLAGGWIFLQALIGLATLGSDMSIAIAAHVGGFVAGLLLARPLLLWRYRRA